MPGSSISQEIRERIREARQAASLTQAELAERYGCTQSTVSGIERGRVQINARGLARMAEILGQPISYFYPSASAEVGDLSDLEQRLLREFRQMPPEWQGLVVDYVGAQASLYRVTEVRHRKAVARAAPSTDRETTPDRSGAAEEPGPTPPFFEKALRGEQAQIAERLAAGEDDEQAILEYLERLSQEAEEAVTERQPDELGDTGDHEVAAEPTGEGEPTAEEPSRAEDDLRPLEEGADRVDDLERGRIYGDRSPEEMARLRLLELIREKAPLLNRRLRQRRSQQ